MLSKHLYSARPTRRALLRLGLLAGGAALLPLGRVHGKSSQPRKIASLVQPFTVNMPLPPVLQPTTLTPAPGTPAASLGSNAVFHGIAQEFYTHPADWHGFPTRYHHIIMEETVAEIVPGVQTPIFTYRDATRAAGSGVSPGPLIKVRFREPLVVRVSNHLDIETSVHLHGGHNPAHSDGFPNFYVLPDRSRDYYYPNIVPRTPGGDFDLTEVPSIMWFHDHGMDVTGHNNSHGLAGIYLLYDDLEEDLMDAKVLPHIHKPYDIPIVLTDQLFNDDGTLFYDFFNHDGRIGDVFCVNGVAQPKFHVQRRKYRFRLLNASNARIYHLRLSTGQPFLVCGTDSWLLPEARPLKSFTLAMANRQDLIVDFSGCAAGTEVYLENIMEQLSGRKPEQINPAKPVPLLKFIVTGGYVPNDVTIGPGTLLRPHEPIHADELVGGTRTFTVDRSHGAWTINNTFFSPRRADAVPLLESAERWILENKSGGWWHPLHIHLEAHQVQKINGKIPPWHRRFKVDTTLLDDNGVAVIFMKFRTFTGPFVFHCHNLEHEDMRMMASFDPRPGGQASVLNGVDAVPELVSGIPDGYDVPQDLRFELLGDVQRLEGRGVGFPEFEPGGETMPPLP